jgi:Protein of unknown function (DUF3124)
VGPFSSGCGMTKRCMRVLLALPLISVCVASAGEVQVSKGQTLYVPIYSHVYSGDKEQPFLLAAILSIRNTDPDKPMTIVSVVYYDTDGKQVKAYLDQPRQLPALASTRFVVPESDTSGGSGAKFIVEWKADVQVTPPVVEAVMIGTKMGQGISFVSQGRVIKENRD